MRGFNIFGWEVNTCYTQTISEFVAGLRYEDIPPQVIERAKTFISHGLGCSLAAAPMESTKAVEQMAAAVGPDGPATCWTNGAKLTPAAACLANGAACDMLDWEDCSYTGHPTYAILPAALAVAEAHSLSGCELLCAFVAAFEAYQRIALCVGDPGKIPHPKYGHGLPNWSIFGASLVTAKLLGFSPDQINQTIGITAMLHPISSSGIQATLSEAYHLEAGLVAQIGYQAALCVRYGVNNMRDALDIPYMFAEHLISEPQRQWLDLDLGNRWMLMEMLLKHWPANMWIQNPLEALAELLREHPFQPEEVEEIVVDPPMEYRMHFRPEGYTSVVDAEFSTPYAMAAALLDPVPSWRWFHEDSWKNPEVLALAAKVHSGPSPSLELLSSFNLYTDSKGQDFPERTVTIRLKDGRILEKSVRFPKGHPRNMLGQDELHQLFRQQTSEVLAPDSAEALFQGIWSLEEQHNVASLTAHLRR